ncbi:hypothetical protein CgunFtcFv8_005842 [Champsocephalus gunnari]|uniref:Uncharacterized protein n=1 Tax=Champsocephalus gunnari TaxID=52237 RepID=A0AAN8CWC9_CHAGU|nr:hypothetical protein CgunFtcFv8_005842 [Champsocephalus gunnari]
MTKCTGASEERRGGLDFVRLLLFDLLSQERQKGAIVLMEEAEAASARPGTTQSPRDEGSASSCPQQGASAHHQNAAGRTRRL